MKSISLFVLLLPLPGLLKPALAGSAQSGTPMKIQSDGVSFNPAVELTDSANKKILIVGMAHVGPHEYYRATSAYIDMWITKDQRQTVVLREFPTCNGVVLGASGSSINQKNVNSLKRSNINFEPISFFRKTSDQIQPVIQAFGMKASACTLDVDGKTKRPGYYSLRNKKLCDQARSEGIACQWLNFNIPDSNTVKNVEGDIEVDTWSAGMQISMSLLLQDYSKLKVDWDDATTQAIFEIPQYLILHYRNYLLVNKVRKLLNSGHSAIVLPWGASHVKGLAAMLKEMGFRQSRVDDIKYVDPSQVGKSSLIDGNYTSSEFPLSDHYDFQD